MAVTIRRRTSSSKWFLILLSSLARKTHTFSTCNPKTRFLRSMHAPCLLRISLKDDHDYNATQHDDDDQDIPVVGRPGSRMTSYVSQFLDKTALEASPARDDDEYESPASRKIVASLGDITEATHLIAIPLESSHELLIELESVQRAILHHCPILLDACIGGASTRLPLLYVKAPDSNLNDNPQYSASVTTALSGTVMRLVKKHIYGTRENKITDVNNEDVQSFKCSSLNAEGYRPLTMNFQSLEIDGENNSILNTVGSFCFCDDDDRDVEVVGEKEKEDGKHPNYNERRFENFIRDLQSAIAAQGWEMAFPPDASKTENEQSMISFRPRVAFMELPKSFDENISRFKNKDTEIDEGDMKFLKAEEGGNGISPIFWCNWWDDVFARNVRLKEIGIYPTNPMMVDQDGACLVNNSQFYIPFETVTLPDGNDDMIKSEKKFYNYHKKRIEENEKEFRKENSESPETSEHALSPGSLKLSEPDVLMTKTRKRLESIYLKNAGFADSSALIEEFEVESPIDNDEDVSDLVVMKDGTRYKDNDYIEDWMRQRIMQASNLSSNNTKKESLSSKENENSSVIADNNQESSTVGSNNVLRESDCMESRMSDKIKNALNDLGSVKNGEVAKKEPKYSIEDNPVFKAYKEGTLTENKLQSAPPKKIGPYPGNDHFVGIWKVVVNPMGDVDNSNIDKRSENLLLRVDGTTAAGPTLNPETKQKAAGGTWKIFPRENGEVLIRIRLVIPPEKKRILVMEGRIDRGSQLGLKMASRTFGIPLVEKKANAGEGTKIMCSGEAYIEDAITKSNTVRAENFYIEKLQGGKDPDNYSVIIPKTIRRLD